jgi:hypothetical protein
MRLAVNTTSWFVVRMFPSLIPGARRVVTGQYHILYLLLRSAALFFEMASVDRVPFDCRDLHVVILDRLVDVVNWTTPFQRSALTKYQHTAASCASAARAGARRAIR